MDTEEKSNQLEHETALNNQTLYWQANLKLLAKLLVVWFAVSFGCGIILVDWLDQFTIAGFKLGFWFAQQGAIYVFVAGSQFGHEPDPPKTFTSPVVECTP